MLFLAEMEVLIPHDADPERIARLQAQEKACAQQLQRSGEWRHLWRVAGRYANISILDVRTIDRLHELLSELPLFPYLDIRVTPLATHASAISDPVRPDELSTRPR
jgi:muconolactone D-isomerase